MAFSVQAGSRIPPRAGTLTPAQIPKRPRYVRRSQTDSHPEPLQSRRPSAEGGSIPSPGSDREWLQAVQQYAHQVSGAGPLREERVRAAEVVAALSLATDLALGMEFEHGLRSTLLAMRLSDSLGVDASTAAQTYYVCLLFYVGCTTDAEIAAEIFPDEEAVRTHINPVLFGSPGESMIGLLRALAPPEEPPLQRAVHLARRVPQAARHRRQHLRAICEVAQMLADRLGLPASVHSLFANLTERWDGKGSSGVKGDDIPLPVRIAHVARDAAFQSDRAGVTR